MNNVDDFSDFRNRDDSAPWYELEDGDYVAELEGSFIRDYAELSADADAAHYGERWVA